MADRTGNSTVRLANVLAPNATRGDPGISCSGLIKMAHPPERQGYLVNPWGPWLFQGMAALQVKDTFC